MVMTMLIDDYLMHRHDDLPIGPPNGDRERGIYRYPYYKRDIPLAIIRERCVIYDRCISYIY